MYLIGALVFFAGQIFQLMIFMRLSQRVLVLELERTFDRVEARILADGERGS
jgi:hypothetical protein